MNLLAVHLVEGGHTDDRGGDGAGDEATRHDGEEGVLEGGVTAASATRGLASAAAVPTVTAAESFSTLELFGAGACGGGEGGSEKYSARGKRPANWHGCVEDRGAVIDERFLADRSRGGASTDGGRDIDPGIFRGRSVTYPGTRRRDRARGSPAWSIAPHPQISRLIPRIINRGGTSKRRWRDSHLATAFTDTAFTAWTRLTVVSRTGGSGRSVG